MRTNKIGTNCIKVPWYTLIDDTTGSTIFYIFIEIYFILSKHI